MERLVQDIRYAVRSLLRSPAFTIAAVLTLAIGIGANTAIFSVVDGVLLRPAPFPGIERLMVLWETDRTSGTTREPAAVPDFFDYRARSRQFAQVAAIVPLEMNLTQGGTDPRRVAGLAVTREYLSMVGVVPTEGRHFSADEDQPNGPAVAMVSEDLARALFAGRSAVGQAIRLSDRDHVIVGVLPRHADFGALQVLGAAAYGRGFADRGAGMRVDAWVPAALDPAASRQTHLAIMLGRLAPDATPATAQQEAATIAAELERTYAESNTGRGANIEPLDRVVFGSVRPAMLLLLAAVVLVLLVACVNVANLLLVRAANRTRELTVRTALGAGMRRLAQQYLVEGALLSLVGTMLGVLVAWSAVQVLASMAPASIPRAATLAVDARVLAVTAGVSIIIAFVFGLLPTLQARRLDLQGVLRDEAGRGASGGRSQRRLRSSLVVAELAMATTLMVGAGLLIRTLWQLQRVDPGFAAAGVLKAEFQLPVSRYPQDFAQFPNWPERKRFYSEVESRLLAQPGVVAVALAAANPLDAGFTSSIRVVGRESEAANWPEPSIRTVSAGYFGTLRVAVLGGRGIEPSDVAASAPVAVINQSARERYFNGHTAIGQRIRLWGADRTVVGIVGNERFKGLSEAAPPAVYLPLDQAPTANAVMVRVSGGAALAAPLVRRIVREVDPQLPLFGVQALTETVKGTMAQRRFTMVVLVAFAVAALVLAIVGVYGVLTYAVAQRTREIGIRVALGADMRNVRDLVVTDGAKLALAGVALGLAGALALSRLMSTMLFGVGARDPVTFAGVAALLIAVSLLASWLPARRAARVDPLVALRAE